MDKEYFSHPVAIAIVLLVCIACFLPGNASDFIFDDSPNLGALAHIQGEPVLSPAFLEYVLGGVAGPTGRPVSLFTFALQASAWPDNPAAFKLINLLIHCLNAILVYVLCCQLCRVFGPGKQDTIIFASLCSLFWAIHPMHTGVVLYAVQRMTLLSSFFMLGGICAYLHFRLSNGAVKPVRQLAWLTLSMAGFGLLALFSKENAPSLVFYLLALEYTLLSKIPASDSLMKWRYGFLWLPAILIIVLPVFFIGTIQEDFRAMYTYGPLDRLLTQSRVLWQYLFVILLPAVSGAGLFHDVEASTSLLSPLTTLLSVLTWLALLGLALWKPGKYRLGLFALLWFLAGHVIESTVLPLELYFNHRNYLAFLGAIIAFMYALLFLMPGAARSIPVKTGIVTVIGIVLAFQTVTISVLYRDSLALSEHWYLADPATDRNVEFYAINLAQRDFEGLQEAAGIYEAAFVREPENFRLLLNRMLLSCSTSFIPRPGDEFIIQSLQLVNAESRDLLSPLQQLVSLTTGDQCNIYSPALLTTIIEALMENVDSETRGLYQFELARLHFYEGENQEGIRLLEVSYDNTGDSGVLFSLALRIINNNQYEEALVIIDRAINRLQEYNNIRSGTRDSKLSLLYEMRADVLGFIENNSQQEIP